MEQLVRQLREERNPDPDNSTPSIVDAKSLPEESTVNETHHVNSESSKIIAKLVGRPLTPEQQFEVTLNQHQEFLGLPRIDWTEELKKLELKTVEEKVEEEKVEEIKKEVIDVRSVSRRNPRSHFHGRHPRKRTAA